MPLICPTLGVHLYLHSFNHFDMLISNIEIPLEGEHRAGLVLSTYDCVLNEEVEIKLSEEHTEYGWFSLKEAALLLSYKYPVKFIEKVKELTMMAVQNYQGKI